MTTFPGQNYAPPGVYVRTIFENPIAATLAAVRIPVVIGTGSEILFEEDFELVRGSSAQSDQLIPEEDQTGRAVVEITANGQVILGDFDGTLDRIQVRNFPIVDGQGTGTVATNRTSVEVTINGQSVVALEIDGTRGILRLAQEPQPGDDVRVTYNIRRTDTFITDNVSDQVTSENAVLLGEVGISGVGTYDVTTGVNDNLLLTVDTTGVEASIVFPAGSFNAAQIVSLINGSPQPTGTLTASVYTNNLGESAIQLSALGDLVMGAGSANDLLGFASGQSSARNRVFTVFQGPIVDGSDGGITTTDPADVVVVVDNVQTVPVAVDGASRRVTLGFAPPAGSTVQISYFFNPWQNTFDYLPRRNVTQVLRAGVVAGRNDFIQGADFILQDDLIVWGTAAVVANGETVEGSSSFGTSQLTSTLIDHRTFLSVLAPVIDTAIVPPVDSRRVFQLPFQPTTGNGRNTPLGQSLYNQVSNGRLDLPTNRPDLVDAFVGFTLEDALARGQVTVTAVDAATSQITLQNPIAPGEVVWASFYYNRIVDETYTLNVVNPGGSSVGTYTILDNNGNSLFGASLGAKSAGLAGIPLEFPSGSELTPDVRLEANPGLPFQGPVAEVVTVTFASTNASPALFSFPGSDPYFPVANASDRVRVLIDNVDLASAAAGIDLDNVTGAGVGFFASLISDEVQYTAASGGATYEITANEQELSLTVDGVLVTGSAAIGAAQTLAAYEAALNAASIAVGAEPEYKGATRFTSPLTVVATEYDTLTLHYTGDVSGASGNQVITLAPGTYNSAAQLVTQINTQLATINAGGGLLGTVDCSADPVGRLTFNLTLAAGDAAGVLEFIDGASTDVDFAVLAGLDTAAATGGTQTKLYAGPIARRFTVGSAPLEHDRLIIRNRLLPGSGSLSAIPAVEQTELVVQGSPGAAFTGLLSGDNGLAGFSSTVRPATIASSIGFAGGQATGNADARDSQPLVTFFDGTGVEAANNIFKFTVDGIPVTVVFTASANGTATALGPVSIAGTVLDQIDTAVVAAGLASSTVVVEGAGIRIVSPSSGATSSVEIGVGSANASLGFVGGVLSQRTAVDVRTVASALMAHHDTTPNLVTGYLLGFASPAATFFAAEALALIKTDLVNQEYLALQSQAVGTASSVVLSTATSNDFLLAGTGFNASAGDGQVGEAGISGFYVTSSDPADGSGTANTSVLNSGTGQDGRVGVTYRDAVTGLTFTLLERPGGFGYPDGESFTFVVDSTFTANSNLPTLALPGVELLVTDTSGTVAGNTATVQTFERGGQEPAVGDLYTVTFAFQKPDFSTRLFTRLNAIENEFGERTPENPVSLAGFLMLLNGAVAVAIKQVPRGEDGTASPADFVAALDELSRPLEGGILVDVVVPLIGNSPEFFQILSLHVDQQSSIRVQQERTANIGVTPTVNPVEIGTQAEDISNDRVRLFYPDGALLTLTNVLGETEQFFAEGYFLAAAFTGSQVTPNLDVATPWTRRPIFGFDRLSRNLNLQEQNQVAVRGVTVITEVDPNLQVRQGLTTDTTDVLTRTPTIKPIVDEVAQRSRTVLDRFIGIKFLPGVLSEVEGTLSAMFTSLVREQIVSAFTGIRAELSADPTTAEVEAFYAPVFPLLYLVLTYNLRSSLQA